MTAAATLRPTGGNARWWAEPEGQAHTQLSAVVRHIKTRSTWRGEADRLHAELYAGGPGAAGIALDARMHYEYIPGTLPYNVCRSASDTLVAKIAKHRPLPQCLTSRGNWKNQKRAKKMSQFLEGEFYRTRIFEKYGKLVVRDAAIFGRGILKIWSENKKVNVERIHPWELFVDEWDARYGEPRSIYHVRTVDVGVVMSRLVDKKLPKEERQEILTSVEAAARNAPESDFEWQTGQDTTVQRVRLVEAWHLPSAEGEDDGRHVISVMDTDITLLDEKWEYETFPFAVLHYSDPVVGYWGQGLVEQLEGFQTEINEMSGKISDAHNVLGGGIIFMPSTSGVIDSHVQSGIGVIIKHLPGQAPTFYNPQPVHPQTYERLRDLPQDALADVGVSAMSAQSQKPAGIESGIALQTLDDIETERFIVFGRSYETWCIELARHFIRCAKEIANDNGEYAVSVPMRGGLLDLKWKDVVLPEVEIKVFPTSLLPQHPAARLEKAKILFDAQLIDRATFLRLLDAPDLSAELDMETADRLVVDEQLELMLDTEDAENDYQMPSPYTNLDWAMRRAQQKLNRAKIDGAPEENLNLLRRYIDDAQAAQDKANARAGMAAPQPNQPAPLPPFAGAEPPPPNGAPMAPPPMPPTAPGGPPPPAMAA